MRKHTDINQKPFINRLVLLIYFCFLATIINIVTEQPTNNAILCIIFFICYLINQRKYWTDLSITATLVLGIPFAFAITYIFNANHFTKFNFEKTDFYAQNYYSVKDLQLKNENPRNVILIFGESLEKDFLKNKKLVVKDTDAVKFENFIEGYAQTWTQGALFSAFTGVHIHYISDYYRYRIYGKIKKLSQTRQIDLANSTGDYFDFITPNIASLGKICSQNGYSNIFVQGSSTKFSGTDKFLLNNGFLKENIFDFSSFKNSTDYKIGKYWWGVSDKTTFSMFKEQINKLNKKQPFFAVMFTLDLHRGGNPFFKNQEDIKKDTIENLNEFVNWFKKQDFYSNTTLVILADHNYMDNKEKTNRKLYNAFYNLPERLAAHLNTKRTFNQIDVFPTLLEIMGFELPTDHAGIGVSLFSQQPTLAEKMAYNEQENIFSKIDLFYQNLWLNNGNK